MGLRVLDLVRDWKDWGYDSVSVKKLKLSYYHSTCRV